MQWQTPSERTQNILVAPIAIPAAALLLVAVLPLLAWAKVSDWLFPPKDWHRWFAWRPIQIDGFWTDTPTRWVWLETIERKRWGFGLWRQHDYRFASGMQLREDPTQIGAEAEGLQPDPKGDAHA